MAGAAVIMGLTGGQGAFTGLPIHEGQHEHLAAGRVLHDGRQQPAHFVEIQGYLLAHNLNLLPFLI